MPHDRAKLLNDMLESEVSILSYAKGKSPKDYHSTKSLRDAVHWNFAVNGEAMRQLRDSYSLSAARLSECQRIIAYRNQIVHGYGVIDHQITWSIIERKLPILIAELRQEIGV